ncbi:MAG TPA: response regulator [Stellaceae bacterium]|nr:response regulator [Stellaceae bacterium]
MAHILVIDDDAVLRRVITLALEAAGHTVLRCENGRKGIDFLVREHTDLLITDIVMPEMDGVETVRAARQLQPHLPILAISGGGSFDPEGYLGVARVFGADAVLSKPFRPVDLVDKVTEMLAA